MSPSVGRFKCHSCLMKNATLLNHAWCLLASLTVLGSSAPRENSAQAAKSETPPGATGSLLFEENRKAAEQGDPKALFELARAYHRGLGVAKDAAKALEYTRLAAEKGYAPAQTALGSFYGRGVGVPQDNPQALRWYRQAAESGDAMAQYALGGFYEAGKLVPKDLNEAIRWLKRAAEQGDAAAQCELGRIYFTGVDKAVSINFGEAVKWLQLAANQGYVGAMNNLGYAYDHGLGGLPMDPPTAAKWYRRAAEGGSAGAQAGLGEMYRTGRGVPRDLVQSYMWLSLANMGGNVDGKHSAPEVGVLLSPTELDRGEKLIADFLDRTRRAQTASSEAQK